MLKFFNKEEQSNSDNDLINVACLMIHAAKIDEVYSSQEKDLVKDFIKSYLKNDDANEILKEAESIENNSIQAVPLTFKFLDIGIPDDFKKAHDLLNKKK